MENGTKKTDFELMSISWKVFLEWIRKQATETTLWDFIHYEVENKNRAPFIDRARTRFNTIRSMRELKELEALSGQVLNVNYYKEKGSHGKNN
jgi:hypothetical protein